MKKRILKLFVYSNLLLCVLILSAGVGEVSAHFIPNNRNRDPGLRDKKLSVVGS